MTKKITILKKLDYIDEQNGFIRLKSDYGDDITNATGKFIIDNMYNEMPINELINIFEQNFAIEKQQAQMDVYTFLSGLKTIKLIDYPDDAFNECYNINYFNIAGEKDFQKISKTIMRNITVCDTTWFNQAKKPEYYNSYLLRSKGFNHQELYFYTYNSNEIISIIGVTNMSERNQPVNICLIQTLSGKDDLIRLYKFLENELIRFDKHKIRIILPQNAKQRIFDLIAQLGFFKEGELLREDKVNDYFIFSKLLIK